MRVYYWKNQYQQGEIEAESMHHAQAMLIDQDITWTVLKRKWLVIEKIAQPLSKKDIAGFLQQLNHLLSTQITLFEAISILLSGAHKNAIRKLLATIHADLLAGHTLNEAFKKHSAHFTLLTCELIHLGEMSGDLSSMLIEIVRLEEKSQRLKDAIKKAAFYPCLVITISLIITYGLLTFIVPQFASFYESFEGQLPVMTSLLINLSTFIQKNSLLLICIFALLASSCSIAIKKIPRLRNTLAIGLLKIPLFGSLIKKALLLRSIHAFSLLLRAGIPLLSALRLMTPLTQHPAFITMFQRAVVEIEAGYTLSEALSHEKLIPHFMKELIKAGEKSGALTEMLDKIILIDEEALNTMTHYLTILIEPLLMIILSLIVAFILLALYLPMFKIGSIL